MQTFNERSSGPDMYPVLVAMAAIFVLAICVIAAVLI